MDFSLNVDAFPQPTNCMLTFDSKGIEVLPNAPHVSLDDYNRVRHFCVEQMHRVEPITYRSLLHCIENSSSPATAAKALLNGLADHGLITMSSDGRSAMIDIEVCEALREDDNIYVCIDDLSPDFPPEVSQPPSRASERPASPFINHEQPFAVRGVIDDDGVSRKLYWHHTNDDYRQVLQVVARTGLTGFHDVIAFKEITVSPEIVANCLDRMKEEGLTAVVRGRETRPTQSFKQYAEHTLGVNTRAQWSTSATTATPSFPEEAIIDAILGLFTGKLELTRTTICDAIPGVPPTALCRIIEYLIAQDRLVRVRRGDWCTLRLPSMFYEPIDVTVAQLDAVEQWSALIGTVSVPFDEFYGYGELEVFTDDEDACSPVAFRVPVADF
ncbi:hypothetical protein J8273_1157 [Carpediemonas membranifera]|uniref:Uncharacterized protein n=1 Tax=Carpediemonas membranifera TaxID=201153 RepID=A0A8J6BGW9_9EUKA|nr:hypothetical protein J8273_1157 [Carpediemonas membranifera]|eukprot:KAG9397242.1 hypothetical protein J8273_1157 [Carpediemonas membranifera]